MYCIAKIDYKTGSELFLSSYGEISRGLVAMTSNKLEAKKFETRRKALGMLASLPTRKGEPWYLVDT